MREYETGFIIQPEISEEGSQAILAKIDDTLEKEGAKRLFLEDQGKRKLAYEIRKFHKGHYYYLSYLDEGQAVAPLERVLRLEESVLRFLTVQRDDEVTDIDARLEHAKVQEEEQQKRAAERAEREAEEARARAAAEAREAEERAAREAAAAEEAAQAAASEEAPSDEEAASAAPEAAPADAGGEEDSQ